MIAATTRRSPRPLHKLTPHDYRKIRNVEWSLRLLFEHSPDAFERCACWIEHELREQLRARDRTSRAR